MNKHLFVLFIVFAFFGATAVFAVSEPASIGPAESLPNCGDGICQNISCMANGCPPPESATNCPQDCGGEAQICIKEGQAGSSITSRMLCCSGLTQITLSKPGNEGCMPTPPDGSFICSKCGNSICGSGENKCNCPQDCGEAATQPQPTACLGQNATGTKKSGEANKCCEGLAEEDYAQTASMPPTIFYRCVKIAAELKSTLPEVKIMPLTASENAIQKLGEVKNVKIELKETGNSSSAQGQVYEVKADKPVKVFGIIPVTAKLTSQINAQTGQVISVKKPWWIFFSW